MPKTDLYNQQGQKTGQIELNPTIFDGKTSLELEALAVRVRNFNARLGTHKTKTRGEVAISGRKLYRQKGTGRARHGAASAPIFVGGGVAHGPRPHKYSKTLPGKMRRQALLSALARKTAAGKVKVVEQLSLSEISTKEALRLLQNLSCDRKTLAVLPKKDAKTWRSFRNLGPNIKTTLAGALNVYDVLNYDTLLLTPESLEILERTHGIN